MLKTKMYVRCPADIESVEDPRVFVCGQVLSIDDFKRTVSVKIHDPFEYLPLFDNLPKGIIELPINSVDRCSFFIGSTVVVNNSNYIVISCKKNKDDYHSYYVQNTDDKSIIKVLESNVIASFNNGQIDPCKQLSRYEFQNPAWYLGRTIVSRSMNILENSIYGFKELAGSKIYLMPHQVNTIMRCLQGSPCRYMLADEVGMGKTIEAISVYKVFTLNNSNTDALVLVPEKLKEQWKAELLLKFNIPVGININHNCLTIKSISELTEEECNKSWDFVIIDEVHRFLLDRFEYSLLHKISKNAENILLLSATPVQQKKSEYLDLLRLLAPDKYVHLSSEGFNILIEKQGNIIQKTALILDDLGDYEEEIDSLREKSEDAHDSDDCQDLYDDLVDSLTEICDELEDEKLNALLEKIQFEDDDLGVYAIKVIVSYICSNYQIESNIIRNRRKLLETSDDEVKLMASRSLVELAYAAENSSSYYEKNTYDAFSDWITKKLDNKTIDVESELKPLLSSFFSSAAAFYERAKKTDMDDDLLDTALNWKVYEQNNVDHINEIIDDPDNYQDSYSSRLVTIIDALYENLYDKQIVLFTNYKETFDVYRQAISNVFPEEEISFFCEEMTSEEIELNSYRFQNQNECRIMLCDHTGGEGRNFQCADYLIHIDLPWDASAIEQRIGRLDRLERDLSRPVVYSVVVYSKDTFEEALFHFFSEGLKIFNQSLSGMEIIMKDINDEIVDAVRYDFKYGLFDKIPKIINLTNTMREVIRKEQVFDAAGFIYRPMFAELRRLIEYYSKNENLLFSTTMLNWASLAGFHGIEKKNGEIIYSASSFSPQSAINSQLIPPSWNEYLNSAQNQFLEHVQSAYAASKSRKHQQRSIRGTFSRKLAIENDYLHFFAPGDAIFDCVVDNALNSCKGCASAFAALSKINWTGIVFTWSVAPNYELLLDNNISLYALSPYRNYLYSEQVISPITINNESNASEQEIVREYLQIVNRGFGSKNRIVHLGKRSHEAKFLMDVIEGRNIEWFKETFGVDAWKELVINARKTSYGIAFEFLKRKSNIKGAREEMERVLSARAANAAYYGLSQDETDELKRTQELVLESLRKPIIRLESAAFIMMVGEDNG